jgi:hypothetical protein
MEQSSLRKCSSILNPNWNKLRSHIGNSNAILLMTAAASTGAYLLFASMEFDAERKSVFVARSRHNNAVERNRGTISYGILIQRAPLEKRFRGAVGGEPLRLGGRQGDEGPGAGSDPGPPERGGSGLLATVPGRKTEGWQGALAQESWGGDEAGRRVHKGSFVAHGGFLQRRGSRRITISRPWPQCGHSCPAWRGEDTAMCGGLSRSEDSGGEDRA